MDYIYPNKTSIEQKLKTTVSPLTNMFYTTYGRHCGAAASAINMYGEKRNQILTINNTQPKLGHSKRANTNLKSRTCVQC